MDKQKNETELTEQEFHKLMQDLELFEEQFFMYLAGGEKYEIIPTTMEDGRLVTKEQISLMTRECNRLGAKVLYKIDMRNSDIVLINPKSMKIGYITEGVH